MNQRVHMTDDRLFHGLQLGKEEDKHKINKKVLRHYIQGVESGTTGKKNMRKLDFRHKIIPLSKQMLSKG